ncbi:hypothetical protein WMF38_57525 [Sorangium sp. So ce118]
MAFFCTKSGVRTIAPGIAKSAGGDIPEYDGTDVSDAAETAARAQLSELAKHDNEAQPSPEALGAAANAAVEELTKPSAGKARNK